VAFETAERIPEQGISPDPSRDPAPPWARADTLIITALLLVAGISHFAWIGVPGSMVYDERVYVDNAFRYLHREFYFDIHPPLAVILMALSIRVFGCSPWSWRLPSAVIGTALVPITYLLGRRMFRSRLAGAIAAFLILSDGMFLVYSRLGLINIAYITFGAGAFLLMFRFIDRRELAERRWLLVAIGVLLGLSLGSKFAIPGITWLLTVTFLIVALITETRGEQSRFPNQSLITRASATVLLVGAISAIFYLGVFLPHFWFGWWRGIGGLLNHYRTTIWYNGTLGDPNSVGRSSWWTWPLMQHPYEMYNEAASNDDELRQVVWSGGNPAIWWSALIAFALAAWHSYRRDGLAWDFVTAGYLGYTAMWVPVHRVLYIYSYMPALFVALLALAGLLVLAWRGKLRLLEEIGLLIPNFAVSWFGLGPLLGGGASVLLAGCYAYTRRRQGWGGRLVFITSIATIVIVFAYFLPIWVATPVSMDDFVDRMWLGHGRFFQWE